MKVVFIFSRFAKSIFLLLLIITIITGCKKNPIDVVQNNVDGGAYIDLVDIQNNAPTESSNDTPVSYFTEEFVEKALKNPALSAEDLIFDRLKAQSPRMRQGGPGPLFYDSDNQFFYYTDTHLRYFEYGNYYIMLVTKKIDGIEYVRDYLIIEKLNPETHLFYSEGLATINGESPGFDITLVINKHRRGLYTYEDDISQAFYVNTQTGKIEEVFFDTIRLTSEI